MEKNIIINSKKYKIKEKEENYLIYQYCYSKGIELPCFCYNENLEIAGNCRICLVKIEKNNKSLKLKKKNPYKKFIRYYYTSKPFYGRWNLPSKSRCKDIMPGKKFSGGGGEDPNDPLKNGINFNSHGLSFYKKGSKFNKLELFYKDLGIRGNLFSNIKKSFSHYHVKCEGNLVVLTHSHPQIASYSYNEEKIINTETNSIIDLLGGSLSLLNYDLLGIYNSYMNYLHFFKTINSEILLKIFKLNGLDQNNLNAVQINDVNELLALLNEDLNIIDRYMGYIENWINFNFLDDWLSADETGFYIFCSELGLTNEQSAFLIKWLLNQYYSESDFNSTTFLQLLQSKILTEHSDDDLITLNLGSSLDCMAFKVGDLKLILDYASLEDSSLVSYIDGSTFFTRDGVTLNELLSDNIYNYMVPELIEDGIIEEDILSIKKNLEKVDMIIENIYKLDG